MTIIKFLLGFAILAALSWGIGYIVWISKGKKTNLLKEADKVFDFFNFKIGLYLIALAVVIFIIFVFIDGLK